MEISPEEQREENQPKKEPSQEDLLREDPNSIDISTIVKKYKEDPQFKDLPDSTIETLIERGFELSSEVQQYSYEGVLPHPSIMEGYEKFYPGVSKVLIDSYVDESNHRRELERKMVNCETANTTRGMNYALLVVIITVIGACISAYLGSTLIGSIIGVGGLATLAYTFIQGKKSK